MYFLNRFRKTLILVPLVFRSLTLAQGTAFQTLWNLDIYSSQKPCAQQCFIDTGGGCAADGIARAIGCEYNPCGSKASNNCYCRTDLQPVAESYITSCVKSKCTVGASSIDIGSAGSIYNSYCSSLGFPVNVPATTTQESAQTTETVASSSLPKTSLPSESSGASSTMTASTSNKESPPSSNTSGSTTTIASTAPSQEGGGGGYSTSDKIALGVGIGIGLPGAILAIIVILRSCCGYRVD